MSETYVPRDERSREEPAGARSAAELVHGSQDRPRAQRVGRDQSRTRLIVDWTRCDGHGMCRVLLPDQVDVDEWGFPVVRDPVVPRALEAEARRAVAACPALALHLETAAG